MNLFQPQVKNTGYAYEDQAQTGSRTTVTGYCVVKLEKLNSQPPFALAPSPRKYKAHAQNSELRSGDIGISPFPIP